MKIKLPFCICISILFCNSCVQPSIKKTIVVKLDVKGIKGIQTVGVLGSAKPLSWRNSLELLPIIKDSLYTTTFSIETGYKFIETKFSINDKLELDSKENRRIYFSDKDTIIYEAKFDEMK